MPRGNNRSNNNNHRARGDGRGRVQGRGRGGPNRGHPNLVAQSTTTAAPRPPPHHHAYPHTNAEIDVVVQQWPEPPISTFPGPSANRGGNMNRGYGPWRGGPPRARFGAGMPQRGMDSPRRGASTPRGRGRLGGRGRGRGLIPDDGGDFYSSPRRPRSGVGVGGHGKAKTMIGRDAPLSDLLYADRPLLRPVKFVRATLTPFLFQHSEDMLKPAVQVADTTEASHVPTADRVAQLFRQTGTGTASDSDSDSEDHALEEVDFADLGQVREEVDAIAQGIVTGTVADQAAYRDEEDLEEVDFADLGAIRAEVDAAERPAASKDNIVTEVFTGVYDRTRDTTQTSNTTNVTNDDQTRSVRQTALPNDSLYLRPSIKILNPSKGSVTCNEDAIPVKKGQPYSKNVCIEEPCKSTAPEPHPASIPTNDTPPYSDTRALSRDDDPPPFFVVDTAPMHPFTDHDANDVILIDRTGRGETLGDQDEERIVYVAPHPRSRRDSISPVSAVPRVKLPRTSMLTGHAVESKVLGGLRSPVREDDDGPVVVVRDGESEKEVGEEYLSLASLTIGPSTSTLADTVPPTRLPRVNAVLRARQMEVQRQRQKRHKNKRSRTGFGAYGAVISEAGLREENARERRRPRWETRRKEDSDLDWGTEDEDEDKNQDGDGVEGDDEVDTVSDGLAGMEIDPDLEMDVDAMKGFLKSMSAEGSRFMTMDDIEDEAQMQREDEEGLGGPDGSSDSEDSDEEEAEVDEEEDEEEVFNIEEEILIAEPEGDKELSEDSDDDELSPRSGFKARLRKLRERSRGRYPNSILEASDDEEDEDAAEFLPWTRSANDDKFIAHINDFLEENSHILSSRDRKQKKAVFPNPHQGYVDREWDVEALLDDPEFTTPVNKKKGKKGKGKQTTTMSGYFDAELEAQWAKDRAKKSARKLERQTARYLAALDPLGGDLGRGRATRKAMRAAARAVVGMDVVTLEGLMRRFVEDAGGRPNVSLPPMDRAERRMVHEMAAAFGVKSMSKGGEGARYTTLIRTSRTGVGVNESKVRALMKRFGRRGAGGKGDGDGGRGGTKGGPLPRHREGDEVGKEAPKIGESNIGFKMLASMGWSEGDRIGGTASVGIETPLTAIIKHSKLGLGATR